MKSSELVMRSQDLFNSEYVSPEVNQANREKWVRAIRILGDRWLLAKHVEKKECVGVRYNLSREIA